MKRLIISIVLFTITHPLFSMHFKHIGKQEGLSQVSVLAIYQDMLGRMWFGTEEGINIYDGEHIITYKQIGKTPGSYLPIGNQTKNIVGDRDGNVFFDSDSSLIRYDIRKQTFTCLASCNVTSVNSNDGVIWVGVSDSIFIWDPQKERLTFVLKLLNSTHQATFIKEDSSKLWWVGTNHGLFVKRKKDSPLENVLQGESFYAFFEDSKQNRWISVRMAGLYKIDKQGTISRFDLHVNDNSSLENQVRGISEDHFGNIWIGTFTGLDKYNPKTNKIETYTHSYLPGSLSHSSVFPIYKDKQGTIWLGTYYGGVNYFNPETDLFTVYSDKKKDENCLSAAFVGHMVEDKKNNLWICTEGGGLNFFNRKTKKFTHYMSRTDNSSVAQNNLKDIAYDAKRNKLYIGTHTGGLSIYDIDRNKFKNLYFEHPAYRPIAKERVNNVGIWKDDLIFTTVTGLFKMNLDTEEIAYLREEEKFANHGCFAVDTKGYLWLTHNNGIWKINLDRPTDRRNFTYGKNGLGNFPIICIRIDKEDRIFLGTRGSGLFQYDRDKQSFISYNTQNSQIASNYCYALEISKMGLVLVSTDKGLVFFNSKTKHFTILEQGNPLPIGGMNMNNGLLACQNGEVFIGGINGMVSFCEQKMAQPVKSYQLYFSELYINNELVRPNDEHQVLTNAIPYTNEITLDYNQNNLKLSFASNNYSNNLREIAYEYKLNGFNEKWIDSSINDISYTNLSPGKYTLIVREKQNDSIVWPQVIQMEITILSPWYASPLAYFIYILSIISISYYFYRFKRSQLMLRNSLELERQGKEAIEKINNAKLQFFSNISHEFRTPLTLITSQIELLLQNQNQLPSVHNKLLKIQKNSNHMQSLITELLDFRKMEQGHVKLKLVEENIVTFVQEIYLSFNEYASAKGFNYHFHAPSETINCWIDPKQLQKVFYNLLSNAFKFNKPNATIDVIIEDFADSVAIKVIDNGIGISKEHLEKIFDRFYQVENEPLTSVRTAGTGIGLSLCKSIVEFHHGTIRVESTFGFGSIFIVTLLKEFSHIASDELVLEGSKAMQEVQDTPAGADPLSDKKELTLNLLEEEDKMLEKLDSTAKYTVLLVEDNDELLETLEALFNPIYHVILAHDGEEGLQKARDEMPDIIVSDIKMPKMAGTEMCTRIKNDFTLCHIPVVLLTALASPDQSIVGLERGADDYITKPFNVKVLLARCNNLVNGRVVLQRKFSKEREFRAETLADNSMDQKFLNSVHDIIERNIENESFDINMMARELCLSRSSFYVKFKALTGMTPNDFVLNTKLKRAAFTLIKQPDMQLIDISSSLGFSSPRYFYRCFKTQFGVSPSEYRKKSKQEIE